jgi:hypothetical protein
MFGAPVPFDRSDSREVESRRLRAHLGEMRIPHTALVGRNDKKLADGAWRSLDTIGTHLEIVEV